MEISRLSGFDDLGLVPELGRAIADQGYTEPTPIQAQAIPLVMAGRDVMGGAQTGTGKTASFTLPILNRLARHANTSTSPARHQIRALILTPTRELTAQVHESVQTYGKYLPLRSAVVYGGIDIRPQIMELRRGIEILVATPGRLLDHIQQKSLNLGQVEFFVLDEADRMLDMGFIPDVRRIISLLPAQRQNLLFSATFSEDIKKLADSFMRNPVLVEVARRNATNESVTHRIYPVARERKRDLLAHLVRSRDMKQVLVFTSTRLGANRLAYQLQHEGLSATAIHGDKSQLERQQALEEFKTGKVAVLVATDVAARGLDIEDLPLVINFELPGQPEDYVHRIGRTGRAGATGEAISLVSPDEEERLEAIERMIKLRIERELVSGFGLDPRDAGGMLKSPQERDRGRERRERDPRAAAPAVAREQREPQRDRSPRSGAGYAAGSRRAPAAPADPIFSRPYEPAVRSAAAGSAAASSSSSTGGAVGGGSARPAARSGGAVAALLGGVPTLRK
jgi:ATP-dependent RNA helicase RhlE